jgi:hypothetical protein
MLRKLTASKRRWSYNPIVGWRMEERPPLIGNARWPQECRSYIGITTRR